MVRGSLRKLWVRGGVSLLEYVVLVGAIIAACAVASRIMHRAYLEKAIYIERTGIVF